MRIAKQQSNNSWKILAVIAAVIVLIFLATIDKGEPAPRALTQTPKAPPPVIWSDHLSADSEGFERFTDETIRIRYEFTNIGSVPIKEAKVVLTVYDAEHRQIGTESSWVVLGVDDTLPPEGKVYKTFYVHTNPQAAESVKLSITEFELAR